MNEPQVVHVLMFLEDGTEALIEPVHSDVCVKGKHTRPWTNTCEGCKFDLLATELLKLHRPAVVNVHHREAITDEE